MVKRNLEFKIENPYIANEVAKILSDTIVSAGKEFLKLVPISAEASIGNNWADK